jgi:hypothetical protein
MCQAEEKATNPIMKIQLPKVTNYRGDTEGSQQPDRRGLAKATTFIISTSREIPPSKPKTHNQHRRS